MPIIPNLDKGNRRFLLGIGCLVAWIISGMWTLAITFEPSIQQNIVSGFKDVVLVVLAFYFGKESRDDSNEAVT